MRGLSCVNLSWFLLLSQTGSTFYYSPYFVYRCPVDIQIGTDLQHGLVPGLQDGDRFYFAHFEIFVFVCFDFDKNKEERIEDNGNFGVKIIQPFLGIQ